MQTIDYSEEGIFSSLSQRLLYHFVPKPVACRIYRCEPGWSWRQSRSLVRYNMWFPVAGSGEFLLNGTKYTICPGSLFLLRPGDLLYATQHPVDRLTVISMPFLFYRPGTSDCVDVEEKWLPGSYVPFSERARMEELLRRLTELMVVNTPLAEIEAQLLAALALLEVYRQDAINHGADDMNVDPRISAVITFIRTFPAARLSLAEAAALAGLSTDYFSRLFKAKMGVDLRSYVLDNRLERAYHLLEETTMNISEIADSLGYEHSFLLTRQFKAKYGYPPSDVRRH